MRCARCNRPLAVNSAAWIKGPLAYPYGPKCALILFGVTPPRPARPKINKTAQTEDDRQLELIA